MNRVLLNKIESTLYDAVKYFEQRGDVDHNGHMFIPNEEEYLRMNCEEALILVQKEIIEDMNK